MAFGKIKEAEPVVSLEGQRRYVSHHLPIAVSGKAFLQDELNKGALKGWALHTVFYVEKHNWIMVVWEVPGDES